MKNMDNMSTSFLSSQDGSPESLTVEGDLSPKYTDSSAGFQDGYSEAASRIKPVVEETPESKKCCGYHARVQLINGIVIVFGLFTLIYNIFDYFDEHTECYRVNYPGFGSGGLCVVLGIFNAYYTRKMRITEILPIRKAPPRKIEIKISENKNSFNNNTPIKITTAKDSILFGEDSTNTESNNLTPTSPV